MTSTPPPAACSLHTGVGAPARRRPATVTTRGAAAAPLPASGLAAVTVSVPASRESATSVIAGADTETAAQAPPPPLPPLPPLARAPALLSPVSLRAGDGTIKPGDLRTKDAAAVAAVVAAMRDTATGRVRKFRQPVVSRTPSVQGVWDPSNTYEEFELRSCKEGVGKGL